MLDFWDEVVKCTVASYLLSRLYHSLLGKPIAMFEDIQAPLWRGQKLEQLSWNVDESLKSLEETIKWMFAGKWGKCYWKLVEEGTLFCNDIKFSSHVGYKKITDEMGGLFKETFWQSVRGAIWFLTAYRKMWEREAKGNAVNNTKRR